MRNMTNYKICVKGEGRDRFDMIEATDSHEAKKIFRIKNGRDDLKYSQIDARVVLPERYV